MKLSDPAMNKFRNSLTLYERFDEEKANNIRKLINVPLSHIRYVRIFDETPTLILLHFIEPYLEIQHVRGIIVNKEDEKIVCKSYPHTYDLPLTKFLELFSSSNDTLNNTFTHEFNKTLEFSYAYEGTLLRCFWNDDVPYISTHHRIHGEKSRWTGPTFGTIFDRIVGDRLTFYQNLDKDKCYVFLMTFPENKLSANKVVDKLLLVSIYEQTGNNSMKRMSTKYIEESSNKIPNINFEKPFFVKNVGEISSIYKNLSFEDTSGIILYNTNNDKVVKICLEDYTKRKNIRGNIANVELRYLEILMKTSLDKDSELEVLTDLYPDKKDTFDNIKEVYKNILETLTNHYYTRYLEKTDTGTQGNYLFLDPTSHYILKQLHKKMKYTDPLLPTETNLNVFLKSVLRDIDTRSFYKAFSSQFSDLFSL